MEQQCNEKHEGISTKKTELMVVSQALLDSTQEYITKHLVLSNSTTMDKSSYSKDVANDDDDDNDEEEERFRYKIAKEARAVESKRRNYSTTACPAEIQFCQMLAQDMVQIMECKNNIAMQNHQLMIENKRLEQRRDEFQSELFLLRMQTQQLKGEYRTLLKKRKTTELEWIHSANDTIINLERLVSPHTKTEKKC